MSSGNVFSRGLSRISRRKRRRNLPALELGPSTTSVATAVDAEYLTQNTKPSLLGRSMDRLRRSIRQSFRRGGRRSPESSTPSELVTTSNGASGHKQEQWQPDEAAVRAGLCHFTVKYLGAVEVYESRGMQVCEGALKMLRSNRRRPIKAVLYVSGDGLRVVDQENNRGLIVDQTIEKVSFCAPDRNNDKGFAYICRDGTSRRWMCHGFHATKESGERLSHAVGCAFSICLERKKKRDEENVQNLEKALNPNWEDKSDTSTSLQRTNQAYQSFRKQIPISERLQDPQSAIVNNVPLASAPHPSSSIAKPRPSPNRALFQRQGSLRAPESSTATQFRRNYSLRTNALSLEGHPSIRLAEFLDLEYLLALTYKLGDDLKDDLLIKAEQIRRAHANFRLRLYRPLPLMYGKQSLHSEPIYEGEEENGCSTATPFTATSFTEESRSLPPSSIHPAAAPVAASSIDVFDFIGPGVNPPATSPSETVERGVGQDFIALPHWAATSCAQQPINTMQSSVSQSNGFNDASGISQINVNTSWNPVTSTSQSSSRSKADECQLYDISLRRQLVMSPVLDGPVTSANELHKWQAVDSSNYSLFDATVASGPPPAHPPPPLPSREVIVHKFSAAGPAPSLDVFGQSIKWDPVPVAPIPRAEDPFDLQWSRLAVGSAMASNPFVTEVQRELRI
ncbi:hypothetical protein GCK32_007680 [Trichostrongylus colubriformis]|uniref:PID domain-containing protein n=1 Tax=Trichostrongylus colubriformis TaxID=6319 RepID=A0AAN8F0V6_TRICO